MKQLILMRHAAAAKSNLTSDFNSPLSGMGESQANAAGDFIADFVIDKVLVSPTKRTTETLSIILQHSDISDIESVRALYEESSVSKIIEIIAEQNSKVNNLMIIGHNPIIHQLVLELSQSDSVEYERIATTMATAQLVIIAFEDLSKWQDIFSQLGNGNITHIFNPNLDE